MPVSTSTGPDPDRPSAPPETALVPLATAEEEDEMMEDVAEMAGGGQVSGQDALANLETTLRPVEKYAVRFLEEVRTCRVWFATVHSRQPGNHSQTSGELRCLLPRGGQHCPECICALRGQSLVAMSCAMPVAAASLLALLLFGNLVSHARHDPKIRHQ